MNREYYASPNVTDEVIRQKVVDELNLGYFNLSDGLFEQAKLNFSLALQFDKRCSEAYWGLALCKLQIRDESVLNEKPSTYKNITGLSEYKKALDYATEKQKKVYKRLTEQIMIIHSVEYI